MRFQGIRWFVTAIFLGCLLSLPLACKKKDNPAAPASNPVDTATFTQVSTLTVIDSATPSPTFSANPVVSSTATPTASQTGTDTLTATATTTFTITPDTNGPTQLSVGDLVITSFESSPLSGADYFYFTPLKDLNAGTTIYMTDEGWDGSLSVPAFTTLTSKDSMWMWTATSSVSAGTQILIADPPSTGTVAFVFGDYSSGGTLSLSGGEDQIFLFQADAVNGTTGVITNLNLITGIDFNITDWIKSGSPTAKHSWQPDTLNPALNGGVTACGLINFNATKAVYDCVTTSGTKLQLNAAVNNAANWNDNISDPSQLVPGCALTVQ